MKKSIFLFGFAACFSFAAWAQPYRMEAHFSDGRSVNLGSSDYWSRFVTGYDNSQNPFISLSNGEEAVPFAYAADLDSIVICTGVDIPTIGAYIDTAAQYSYTRRLIADVAGADTLGLSSPGQNYTFFVASDEAWERFFKGESANPWGVTSYEELTDAQKEILFGSYVLDDSQWERRLSGGEMGEDVGTYFRTDPVGCYDMGVFTRYVPAASLPSGQDGHWDALIAQGGAYVGYPEGDAPAMLAFTRDFMDASGMTDLDCQYVLGGKGTDVASDEYTYIATRYPYGPVSLYVNGCVPARAVAKCLNGYVYEMWELTVPPGNMADELATQSDCSLFSSFLDRFTMPVAIGHTSDGSEVYRKVYFASEGSYDGSDYGKAGAYGLSHDSSGNAMPTLAFDPTWHHNTYSSGTFQQDMAAMFVPTDEALTEWWNSSMGQLVMDGLNDWSDVENSLLAELLNVHMKTSFTNSLPSNFSKILNDGNREQGIEESDVVRTILANNGVIYVVNKVYTPDVYISVVGPLLNVSDLTVMYRAVTCTGQTEINPGGYRTYLESRDSTFMFMIPTNTALLDYRDPVYWNPAWSSGDYRQISFEYDPSSTWVSGTGENYGVSATYQDVTNATSSTGSIGATKGTNLLKDILENCIIVMDGNTAGSVWFENKPGYFQTKGGAMVYIDGFNEGGKVYGGGNDYDTPASVETFYNQSQYTLASNQGLTGSDGNGVCLRLDQVVQPSRTSVLEALAAHSEFSEFYALLTGLDEVLASYEDEVGDDGEDDETSTGGMSDFLASISTNPDIALLYNPVYTYTGTSTYTRSQVISFLGDYNYTLFAPTNDAMAIAYEQGLPHWSDLMASGITDEGQRQICRKIMNFIRTHFQDTSVATDGTAGYHKSQAFNSDEGVFYELYFDPTNGVVYTLANADDQANLIDPETKAPASGNLSNIISRDYRLSAAATSDDATISSSAHVLIHAIDAPLFFSGDDNGNGIRDQFE